MSTQHTTLHIEARVIEGAEMLRLENEEKQQAAAARMANLLPHELAKEQDSDTLTQLRRRVREENEKRTWGRLL